MIRLENGNYNFEGNRMNDKMRELNISTEEDIICVPPRERCCTWRFDRRCF